MPERSPQVFIVRSKLNLRAPICSEEMRPGPEAGSRPTVPHNGTLQSSSVTPTALSDAWPLAFASNSASIAAREEKKMRLPTLIFVALMASACGGGNANLQCAKNSVCDLSPGGVCASPGTGNGWCSYPDPTCPSGYRYSDDPGVGDGVSGMCVANSAPDAGVDAGIDASAEAGIDANVPAADWATRYGSTGDDFGTGIALASNGDSVAVGSFQNTITLGGPAVSSAGLDDIWVARYRADGSSVWSVRLGGTGSDSPSGVAVDSSGDVYVVGDFGGPVDFGGGTRTTIGSFLVKLTGTTGAYQWDRVAPGRNTHATHVSIAGSTVAIGGVFVGTVDFGTGNLTSGSQNSFIAAYQTSTGAPLWSKSLAATGFDSGFAGMAPIGGDIVAAGAYVGTANLGGQDLPSTGNADIFLVRYDAATGTHLWSAHKGGSNVDRAIGIATDGTKLYVCGRFLGTTNFGGTDLVSAGSFDAFVAAFSATDGAHIWSQHFGDTQNDLGVSVAVGPIRVSVAISFLGTMRLGTQSLTSHSSTMPGTPSNNPDIAIVQLATDSGTPSLAAQFGSVGKEALSIAYSTDGRLMGVGSFSDAIDSFGSHLQSDGQVDIASFRVAF